VPVFVVQKHAATSLHYDFRLEVDGVMRSWAVPKGPSTDPRQRRLAMAVDDHSMSHNSFEGVIGRGYGSGAVIIWDRGEYRSDMPMAEALADGYARFTLEGSKLRGEWSLRRFSGDDEKNSWLLAKRRDEQADPERDVTRDEPESVVSGLTIEQIAERG
jgi:DNA ligase D-like protein (predicted 3'-phosphoesterase)